MLLIVAQNPTTTGVVNKSGIEDFWPINEQIELLEQNKNCQE
jgi:hypothetical protein